MTRLEHSLAIDRTLAGRTVAMALAKFGEIVVGSDTWADFVEECDLDERNVAEALAALRLRGYASKDTVPHPNPPSPYIEWTLAYTVLDKPLPIVPTPKLDADAEPTEAMLVKRAANTAKARKARAA